MCVSCLKTERGTWISFKEAGNCLLAKGCHSAKLGKVPSHL